MLYGGRDPVTGRWRELRTDEYRYKRPWSGTIWWTIGNKVNPVPSEYKATLSDPYMVYAKLPVSEPIPDIDPMPAIVVPDLVPKALREKVPDIPMPMAGGIAIGALILAGAIYKFRSDLKQKLEAVKTWIGLKRPRRSRR